jgi:hypothetical protein
MPAKQSQHHRHDIVNDGVTANSDSSPENRIPAAASSVRRDASCCHDE